MDIQGMNFDGAAVTAETLLRKGQAAGAYTLEEAVQALGAIHILANEQRQKQHAAMLQEAEQKFEADKAAPEPDEDVLESEEAPEEEV